jgi:hypothetical protein
MRTPAFIAIFVVLFASSGSSSTQPKFSAAAVPTIRQVAGKAIEDDPDPYRLEIDTNKSTWTVDDPGGKLFKTKSGKYVVVVNTTSLKDSSGKVVGTLINFNPNSAKVGDHGNGEAMETGRHMDWNVIS